MSPYYAATFGPSTRTPLSRQGNKGRPIKNVDVQTYAAPEHRSEPLTGHYTRQGSKLTGPVTLLLVHRAATTKAKAETFVLRVLDDGRRSYVSSLWDTPSPGTYAIEYRGIRYAVTLTDDAAMVSAGGTVNSNVPPVAKNSNTSSDSSTAPDLCSL